MTKYEPWVWFTKPPLCAFLKSAFALRRRSVLESSEKREVHSSAPAGSAKTTVNICMALQRARMTMILRTNQNIGFFQSAPQAVRNGSIQDYGLTPALTQWGECNF